MENLPGDISAVRGEHVDQLDDPAAEPGLQFHQPLWVRGSEHVRRSATHAILCLRLELKELRAFGASGLLDLAARAAGIRAKIGINCCSFSIS
jgi:hypothetical protein